MEDVRVAQPIISKNTAQAGKPVSITIETAPTVAPPPESGSDPIDPNSPEERANLIPQQSWQTDPLFYELANFMGVEEREYDVAAERISVITDWAIQQAKSNKVEDILHSIRGLEEKLQPPPWGERRFDHIYRFLRMESRYNSAKKALGAYTKTGAWG